MAAQGKSAWTANRKASNAAAQSGREARKKARIAKQAAAHKENVAEGYTLWELSQARRAIIKGFDKHFSRYNQCALSAARIQLRIEGLKI